MTKNIIFHHPLPLDHKATSASGIRPIKLLETFKKMGYSVTEITGYSIERKIKILKVIDDIQNGEKFSFCYSESSTMPTALTDKDHFPRHPFIDYKLFRVCKKNNIPVKLFYRDIYWKFSSYKKNVKFPFYFIAQLFYSFDLIQYKKNLNTLYLPSIEMKKYIPELDILHTESLPSGTEIMFDNTLMQNKQLHLLYIGGIGNHYSMTKLFKCINEMKNIELTVCCRIDDWNKVKNEYSVKDNITILHYSGKDLDKLYSKSDICMLFINKQQYWEFAVPFKLFEYLGRGKPIISSANTWVGNYVSCNDVGWTIEYTEESLKELLEQLQNDRQRILEKQMNVYKFAKENTWFARVKQIEENVSK